MYIFGYVMTGRTKGFTGNTTFEIHQKFLNEYKEAEKEVRKVEIFKRDVDVKDFAMVISYDVFKEYLLSNKYSIDEVEFMCRGSDRRVQ